jgi:hypothetical protein
MLAQKATTSSPRNTGVTATMSGACIVPAAYGLYDSRKTVE